MFADELQLILVSVTAITSGILSKDYKTGAPNESIVQNHLNIALLNVF